MLFIVSINEAGKITSRSVDDDYVNVTNEIILTEDDYSYFTSNARFAFIQDGELGYNFTKDRRIEESVYVAPENYRYSRFLEYPPVGDQLDVIWDILTPAEGTEAFTMKEAIMAVKAKYPKPEEPVV